VRAREALGLSPRRDTELDSVIAELRAIEHATGIGRKLVIGELILTRFFAGDVQAWRARHTKSQSLRKIAGRADCPFGKSTLHEAVGVYVATLEHPEVRTFEHVSASHIAAVLPLSVPIQAELLRAAETERWSVRRLKREARARRDGEPTPPSSNQVPVFDSVRTSLRQLRESLGSALAKRRDYPSAVALIRRARGELGTLIAELDAAL
jgi:hypothetical protein